MTTRSSTASFSPKARCATKTLVGLAFFLDARSLAGQLGVIEHVITVVFASQATVARTMVSASQTLALNLGATLMRKRIASSASAEVAGTTVAIPPAQHASARKAIVTRVATKDVFPPTSLMSTGRQAVLA